MLKPSYTKQFGKDVEKASKRNRNMDMLKDVADRLIKQQPLEAKYREHKLKGQYADHRECHIQPDWLLIYLISDDSITFVRTGSHSELFRK